MIGVAARSSEVELENVPIIKYIGFLVVRLPGGFNVFNVTF